MKESDKLLNIWIGTKIKKEISMIKENWVRSVGRAPEFGSSRNGWFEIWPGHFVFDPFFKFAW